MDFLLLHQTESFRGAMGLQDPELAPHQIVDRVAHFMLIVHDQKAMPGHGHDRGSLCNSSAEAIHRNRCQYIERARAVRSPSPRAGRAPPSRSVVARAGVGSTPTA